MEVVVQSSPFDPFQAIVDYQKKSLPAGKYGAAVTFVGTMRDINESEGVSAMTLEHYPGMTENEIEKVCKEAAEQWEILDALVIHRCGQLQPDDPIVLVAVWSTHRAEAFDACRYIINFLKQRAPFWKREITSQGERWVEKNTEDSGVR
jgi:molybdopterin synthase catalytic subunit